MQRSVRQQIAQFRFHEIQPLTPMRAESILQPGITCVKHARIEISLQNFHCGVRMRMIDAGLSAVKIAVTCQNSPGGEFGVLPKDQIPGESTQLKKYPSSIGSKGIRAKKGFCSKYAHFPQFLSLTPIGVAEQSSMRFHWPRMRMRQLTPVRHSDGRIAEASHKGCQGVPSGQNRILGKKHDEVTVRNIFDGELSRTAVIEFRFGDFLNLKSKPPR